MQGADGFITWMRAAMSGMSLRKQNTLWPFMVHALMRLSNLQPLRQGAQSSRSGAALPRCRVPAGPSSGLLPLEIALTQQPHESYTNLSKDECGDSLKID